MTALAAAVQFLLITPAFVRRTFTARELGASIAYYPLVGLLLGAVLSLLDALLATAFPPAVRAALILILWVVLTGGLHFDGLLDACDGLLGGGSLRRRLEIMRDERTGAFGVAAGILVLLAAYGALSAAPHTDWGGLVLAPVLGRCAMAVSVVTFPYARDNGLGRDIKDQARPGHAAAAVFTSVAVAAAIAWQHGASFPLTAVTSAIIVWMASAALAIRRIGGMTGDIYGAMNMLVETSVLMAWAVRG